MNVDAAWRSQRSSLAVVVRDMEGKIRLLASKVCFCESLFEAEVKMLEWVSGLIKEKRWRKIVWSSYALIMVNEIKS